MDTEAIIESYHTRQSAINADSTAYDHSLVAREWAEWLENPGAKEYDSNGRTRDPKAVWEATTSDLEAFLHQQLHHGFSGGTVRRRRWSLATFYEELKGMSADDYGIPDFEDPMEDLDTSGWGELKKGPKKVQEQKEVYYLEPEQIEELAENVSDPKLRNELLIRLLYHTGLRRGELANTRLEDIDTDERSIKVRSTKTHINRTVYYQPSLNTLINRWINVERKSLATAGSEYLFPTFKTEQISPKQINRVVRKAADNAGLQAKVYTNAAGHDLMKVTAHVLRHSFAVQCVNNDMDTRTLQILMGHAEIDTTERYLRLGRDRVKNSARRYGPGSE